MPREACLHTGGAVLVDSRGSLADRQPFENCAGLEDLDRLLVRDLAHARSAVRLSYDEAVLLEPDQRRAHRTPRHTEGRADVRLDETGVGGDVAADDRRPKDS